MGVLGAHSTPPSPVAVFKGPTSKGREEWGRGERRREGWTVKSLKLGSAR